MVQFDRYRVARVHAPVVHRAEHRGRAINAHVTIPAWTDVSVDLGAMAAGALVHVVITASTH